MMQEVCPQHQSHTVAGAATPPCHPHSLSKHPQPTLSLQPRESSQAHLHQDQGW